MRVITKYLMVALSFSLAHAVFAASELPLISGDSRNLDGNFANEEIASSLIGRGAYGMKAYVNPGSETYYYVLLDKFLVATDLAGPSTWNKWPLTRWEHEYIEPQVISRYEEVNQQRGNNFDAYTSVGCLGKSPLRYGDIDSNGSNELVLFLGNDLVLFSPQVNKVIFSAPFAIDDWMTREESENYFRSFGGIGEANPQYQSSIAAGAVGNWQGGRFPGYRGYGKIYFGDFDENGARDILAWRKLYESYLRSDEEQGFHEVRETFLHYSLTNGEYIPQPTSQEIIQSWLAENDVVWSDGYPRLSECPGEEGRLIPEMHDPLLNDPDVIPSPTTP